MAPDSPAVKSTWIAKFIQHPIATTSDRQRTPSYAYRTSLKKVRKNSHGPTMSLLFWLCSHVSCYLDLIEPQASIDTSPSQDLCVTVLSKIQDIVLVSGHMFRDPVRIAFSSSSFKADHDPLYPRPRQYESIPSNTIMRPYLPKVTAKN